ncbi:MAG: biotin--protein ligase [Alphaproteobacteria bacterium]|nr:biotin--protein ligase [Alphaproteobacteria bacterium]
MIRYFFSIMTLLIFLPISGINVLAHNNEGVNRTCLQDVLTLLKSKGNKVKEANVLVYNDEGVDRTCLQWVLTFFKKRGNKVTDVNADFLINDTKWITRYDKIVVPGGADCPYHKKLKGAGCNNIKKFVENGGTYIGICAGGYFGSKKVEFGLGTDIEVNEDRELAFFPGVARGPMLKPYAYDSEDGASAAKIRSSIDGSIFYSYHNGGSTFVLDGISQNGIEVLAEYADENNAPAVIRCKYGKGQAILSGIHFEADQKFLYSTSPREELDKIKPIAEKVGSTAEIQERFVNVVL